MKSERTLIRKKLLEPDVLFGEQIAELTGIVERAIDNIDTQVKDYEQRQRDVYKRQPLWRNRIRSVLQKRCVNMVF